jgi:hypothetical protein
MATLSVPMRNTVDGRAPRAETLSGSADAGTLHGLADSDPLQRNLNDVDPVNPPVLPAVTAAKHGFAGREQLAQYAGGKLRVPGCRHARAHAVVDGVERIFPVSRHVTDGCEPEIGL